MTKYHVMFILKCRDFSLASEIYVVLYNCNFYIFIYLFISIKAAN